MEKRVDGGVVVGYFEPEEDHKEPEKPNEEKAAKKTARRSK